MVLSLSVQTIAELVWACPTLPENTEILRFSVLDGWKFYLYYLSSTEPHRSSFQGSLLGQSTGCLKRLITLTSGGILPEVYDFNLKVLICVSLRRKRRDFKLTIF